MAHFFKVSFLLKFWFFNFTLFCQFWNLASVSPTSGHSHALRCYFILGVYLRMWVLANSFSCRLLWVASLVVQRVKRLPAMWETWVQSLGWEDPLEKEMTTHSSTLAWKIPWMEEPGRLQSMGSQRVGHDWAISLTHSILKRRVKLKPLLQATPGADFILCTRQKFQNTTRDNIRHAF